MRDDQKYKMLGILFFVLVVLVIGCYCKSGKRSKKAATLLRSMGYVNTFNIGSIDDWK